MAHQQQPPAAPNVAGIPNFNVSLNEEKGMAYMRSQNIPDGIAQTIIKEAEKCPMRFFILDDSGSMASGDGFRVLHSGNKFLTVGCSRWEEMVDTVGFHLGLSRAMNAPCEFRFLNGLAPKRVGVYETDPDDVNGRAVQKKLEAGPNGMTPLCFHVTEVINEIAAAAQTLKENSQHVSVVIMCDGDASDGNMAQAMRPLAHLPCNVVVRLCTSDDRIVEYWNNVDAQLEVTLDILDDPIGEAEECGGPNPWLNYGLPLHRMREWGVHIRELDLIDESLLTHTQLVTFLATLFGCNKNDFPHPQADWAAFKSTVQSKLSVMNTVYNPLKKRMEPWVNISVLGKCYAPAGCCSVA